MRFFLVCLLMSAAFAFGQDSSIALEDEQAFRFAVQLEQKELFDLAAA